MGVEIARAFPVVINMQIAGSPMTADPLVDLDHGRNGWQNTQGTPDTVGAVGNLIALSPVPDGAYAITADVLRAFPVPANDDANIQIGREHIDSILDYAEHLSMFKLGAAEVRSSEILAQRFVRQATRVNHRLIAQSRAVKEMLDQSTDEFSHRPYDSEPDEKMPRTRQLRGSF